MQTTEFLFQNKSSILGVGTGFRNLDKALLGLKDGEMTILAARPSTGKTSLAMNIAEHVSLGKGQEGEEPVPVGVFSLEMGREQLALRMKCSNAKVSWWKLIRGFCGPDSFQRLVHAAAVLSKAELFVDDSGGLDIAQLRFRARRWKEKHGIRLLVVDYLQLLHDRTVSKQGRQIEVSSISANLKECAKELQIPVLAVAQLSRKTEEKGREGVPVLSDLRDSGSIEQDADNVLLMRRPCMYDNDPEHADETLCVIHVAKHRNGPVGYVRLNFISDFTRFEDRAAGTDQEAGE